MVSAARLKEVMRQWRSTVKTPSEMLSRIASVEAGATSMSAGFCFKVMVRRLPIYPWRASGADDQGVRHGQPHCRDGFAALLAGRRGPGFI